MIKKIYEEIVIHIDNIDNQALARLLELPPGFTLQHVEEVGLDFHLIFSRKADPSEQRLEREERKGLFE
ncbi:MAG: hypothetical protein M3361_22355 [Candidatus Tectomicrobia bacterium]|nr:hypothetical protein [Candidatus Tectomicrobia bacterium]